MIERIGVFCKMKAISAIAAAVQGSTTLAIDSQYKAMKAQGIDVVGFGAGEPDFNTPDNIKQAGIRAIEENQTRYTPAAGLPALKVAVCRRMREDIGLDYQPSQVVVASGAKHNVYIALQVLLDPGDEVILPAPYWVSYYEMIKMAGGVPVVVTCAESADFKISAQQLAAAITPRTKAVILNTPSNPTGMVYTRAELEEISEVCVQAGIYVIADEIYYKLIYDGTEFVSIATLGEQIRRQCIIINGVSKSYAMTGWRIGYALAEPEVTKAMANYVSHATSAPSTMSQYAAIEALNGPQDTVEQMRQEFEKRRNHLCQRMNAIEGVSCLKPQGAFYVMMNMSSFIGKSMYGVTIRSSEDFANLFLEKGLVATVPCSGFGAPKYLRWSYATSLENINKGLDRLEEFIRNC